MEISIAGWIMTIAEGFVSEVVLSEKDGWIRKIKYKMVKNYTIFGIITLMLGYV